MAHHDNHHPRGSFFIFVLHILPVFICVVSLCTEICVKHMHAYLCLHVLVAMLTRAGSCVNMAMYIAVSSVHFHMYAITTEGPAASTAEAEKEEAKKEAPWARQ